MARRSTAVVGCQERSLYAMEPMSSTTRPVVREQSMIDSLCDDNDYEMSIEETISLKLRFSLISFR